MTRASERVKRGKRRYMLVVASACRVAVAAAGEHARAVPLAHPGSLSGRRSQSLAAATAVSHVDWQSRLARCETGFMRAVSHVDANSASKNAFQRNTW